MTTSGNKEFPIIKTILENRRINIYIFISYLILSIVIVFFVFKKQYTSEVSVIPSAANFTSGIASKIGNIGKMAGIDIGASSAQSQDMYVGIINSRRLLESAIFNTYIFEYEKEELRGNLVELLEIEGDTDREILEKTLKAMREEVVYTEIDDDNEILYIQITTPFPELSAQVANFIAIQLNMIVQKQVQKEYRQQLDYLNSKIFEVRDSLQMVENDLKTFLASNADPTTPSFQVEQLKLKRQLDVQTQIYIEMRKQLEIFMLENLINLSDIKVLDNAIPAYKKSRPKRLLLLVSFVVIGIFLHAGIIGANIIFRNFIKDVTK